MIDVLLAALHLSHRCLDCCGLCSDLLTILSELLALHRGCSSLSLGFGSDSHCLLLGLLNEYERFLLRIAQLLCLLLGSVEDLSCLILDRQ